MVVLNIFYTIIFSFILVFLDGLFTSLFGFKILFFVFLLLYKKIDLKMLVLVFSVIFLISDVVSHMVLGTNMIISFLSFGFFLLLSLFFSTERGFFSYIVRTFTFLVYYLLLWFVPPFMVEYSLGSTTLDEFWIIAIKAVVSSVLIGVFYSVADKFRSKDNRSKVRLK